MAFLLDTTALSELTKPNPDNGLLRWMDGHSTHDAFIGAHSIGELEIGICLLKPSKKRSTLESWLQNLIDEFDQRILAFDLPAARVWARAVAKARMRGTTLPATDSQIAAIAHARNLTVVTRNTRHFRDDEFPGLRVVNPWSTS